MLVAPCARTYDVRQRWRVEPVATRCCGQESFVTMIHQ